MAQEDRNGATTTPPSPPPQLQEVLDAALAAQAAAEAAALAASTSPVAAPTNAAASKATPVDADLIPLVDSAASFVLKKLTWANLKATLKTYFDTLYGPTVVTTSPRLLENVGLSVSMAGSAVTIALKGANGSDPSNSNIVSVGFRNATLTNGQSSKVNVTSAVSTVISNGSTGGTVNNVTSRIWVGAILNAGAIELAWYNSVSGNTIAPINENGLISTTAEGGAGGADSAQVWYSTTARSNVPLTILGYFDSLQTTAGAWAAGQTALVIDPKYRPGDVVQRRFAIKTDTQTHSTTYTDVTGLTLTLTPTSAANKVNYACNLTVGVNAGGTALAKAIRDSTDIFVGDAAGARIRASAVAGTLNSTGMQSFGIFGLDSPNTASAVTYKVAFQGIGGTTVYINRTPTDTDSTSFMRPASTLLVEEISA